MLFTHRYPYTDLHDLQLDDLLQTVADLEETVSGLVNGTGTEAFFFLSSYTDENALTETALFQSAVNHAGSTGKILYVDKDVPLETTITLPSHCYITSNPNKYRIYTNDGQSETWGLNLLEAYDKEDIRIWNVSFENTGYAMRAADQAAQYLGYLTGYGIAIGLAGCKDCMISGCRFFKCGGYQYGEGCATVWLSCCQDCQILANHIELGDNGIVVDRYYQNIDANAYNNGITIADNVITQLDGRAIVFEGINSTGSVTITGNVCKAYGVAGFEGRDFFDITLSGNVFDGSSANRVSPDVYYGLSGAGWDWSAHISADANYAVEHLGKNGTLVISGNVFKNHDRAIYGNSLDTLTVTGNEFNTCTYFAMYMSASTSDAGSVNVTGNNFFNCDQGVTIARDNSYETHMVTIADNAFVTANRSIALSHVNQASVTGNTIRTESKGIYASYVTNLALTGNSYICTESPAPSGSYAISLADTDNVLIDECISGYFQIGIETTNCENITQCGRITDCVNGIRSRYTTQLVTRLDFVDVTNAVNVDNTVTGSGECSFSNVTDIKPNGCSYPIRFHASSAPNNMTYGSVGDVVILTVAAADAVMLVGTVDGSPTWHKVY